MIVVHFRGHWPSVALLWMQAKTNRHAASDPLPRHLCRLEPSGRVPYVRLLYAVALANDVFLGYFVKNTPTVHLTVVAVQPSCWASDLNCNKVARRLHRNAPIEGDLSALIRTSLRLVSADQVDVRRLVK